MTNVFSYNVHLMYILNLTHCLQRGINLRAKQFLSFTGSDVIIWVCFPETGIFIGQKCMFLWKVISNEYHKIISMQ